MRPRLVLLSALGTDSRLYEPQRALPVELVTPDYPEPGEGESLRDFARRVPLPDPPFALGGVSMGGMVAQAMCAFVRPTALFLIATSRRGADVAPELRLLERLTRAAPDVVVKNVPARWATELDVFGRLTAAQKSLLLQMWVGRTTTFLKRSSRMIAEWPGEGALPAHQIHGDQDQLIPIATQSPDVVVRGGGHMINLTHAEEVNRFIIERI